MKVTLTILCILILSTCNLYSQIIDTIEILDNPDCVYKTNEDSIIVVEYLPVFPGGTEGLKKYIYSNISINPDSIWNDCVIVQFWIDTSGNAVDAKILRGTNEKQNLEALNLVNNMPKWKPAEQGPKKIKIRYIMPINFNRQL